MAIADGLGYLREHEVTPPALLLWSGAVEEIPPRLADEALEALTTSGS
ncbi:hypothetical protein [Streptomyces massasporeus]|nr:hypothetical protein [Streptomyces massasporeus]GGV76885.1 hypothetical protein GCM10010228_42710 [Streptomyces massasporeus]